MNANEQKSKILEAALNVVYRETVAGTRMHLIAAEAGMVQSNVHYYFKSKKDLLAALFAYTQDTYYKQERAIYAGLADASPEQIIRGFFRQKRDFLLHYPKFDYVQFSFWSYAQVDADIHSLFTAAYAEWEEHIGGLLIRCKPELSPREAKPLAHLVISQIMGGIMQYFNDREAFPVEAYYETCTDNILRHLGLAG